MFSYLLGKIARRFGVHSFAHSLSLSLSLLSLSALAYLLPIDPVGFGFGCVYVIISNAFHFQKSNVKLDSNVFEQS